MLLFLETIEELNKHTLLRCINTDFIRDFEITKHAKDCYALRVLYSFRPQEEKCQYEEEDGYTEYLINELKINDILEQLKKAGLRR